jgi:hypothetical protein
MHRNRWWSEVGQDLVEYVLLAGFVTLIVVAVPVLLLKRPDLAKNAALLALVGGVMAVWLGPPRDRFRRSRVMPSSLFLKR